MRTLVALYILLFVSHNGYSNVIITGKHIGYAKSELVIKTFADPFTGAEIQLSKCQVSDSGIFTFTIAVNETMLIVAHLGIYKGFMYIEPGKQYEILLPDKVDKTPADKLNPFYEETEFQFPVKNLSQDDLNFKILVFDDAYRPYLQKFAENIYARNKTTMLDTTIAGLRKIFTVSGNTFFDNYVEYKIGYLKHLAYQQKSRSVSRQYFEHKPVLYNNPSYINLFNQVYNKYFYYFGLGTNGKGLYSAINESKSYTKLTQVLLRDSILLNDSLRELVILKNIHDEFYASNFSRSGLLLILDSLIGHTKSKIHVEYANIIKEKITRLMTGYEPPTFELFDKNKQLVSLLSLKGSYVYLNFCSCASYGCLKEFGQLKRISEKYHEKLVILTISTDESLDAMIDYVQKSEYNWVFLHYGNQPDVLEKYDVRAYPCYFFIGPDGKLINSPAKSPAENFEMDLFKAMRARGDI